MDNGIGVRVLLVDACGALELGRVSLPVPVEPGDLAALEHGPPWRLLAVAGDGQGGVVATAEPVRLVVTG